MTKMIINQKNFSKREIYRVVSKYYHNQYTMRYKRGQIYLFFPNKDLNHTQAVQISKSWGMTIVSESFVRVVIGY